MGIMNRSGFSTQISRNLNENMGHGPDFPDSNINTVPNRERLLDPVGDLNNKDFVKDPHLQGLAISTENYPQSYNQLQAYMQGHQMTCIYFSRWNTNDTARSNQVDSVYLKNIIHSAWLRINGYVINLTAPFTFNAESEQAEVTISFVGRTYPSTVDPKVGDYIVTAIGDGKEGLFVVSTVTRQSWRTDSAWEIGAYFVKTLDKEHWDVLNGATVQVKEFSLLNYATGNKALLSSEEAGAQKSLAAMRDQLANRYFRLFYSRQLDTLMRPDGYYDPYVVRFVNDQTDINVTHYRARQLLYEVEQSYWKTIYARLETNDSRDTDLLYPDIIPEYRNNVTTDAYVTALTGRGYLTMDYYNGDPKEGGVPYEWRLPYVCSRNFYMGYIELMPEWEQFLFTALRTNQVTDFKTLQTVYLQGWQQLSPMEQFYRIPIYIWLIDKCLSSITTVVR